MSLTLKPYPEYKDSGLPWLGKIPAHWEIFSNRALFSEVNERDQSDEEMLSVTISSGVMRQADLLADSFKKDSSNEDRSSYKLVEPNDITYNKMRAWQGALGVSRYRGIISPAYVVARPRTGVRSNYFHYLFRTPAFTTVAESWSYGITSDQWSLRAEDFKRISCALPSVAEQDAIVRFLDRADRIVNHLIRAKQRLIELLNEQKQAIIHRAVTRGLDFDVPMKPTGLDWLPEVPEHWEVVSVKRLLARMDYGTSENLGSAGSVRVLTMGHIQDGEIKLPEVGSLDSVPSELILKTNDLLFNRTNSPELVGKVGIFRGSSEDRVSFASYLVRLRPTAENDSEFLNLLLNSRSFLQFARSQALVCIKRI